MKNSTPWIALVIGNSRLHWAWILGDEIQHRWDTGHWDPKAIAQFCQAPSICPDGINQIQFSATVPIVLASVVPDQAQHWQRYQNLQIITLDQIPMPGFYKTLGSDRALASLAAWTRYQTAVLVIDGGTALTFTAVDDQGHFAGGAILPGIRLQGRSLSTGTAQLPDVSTLQTLPDRWAMQSVAAIQSGIVYGILATVRDFVSDWWNRYPHSPVLLTGGDGLFLYEHLQTTWPNATIEFDANLVITGIIAWQTAIAPSLPNYHPHCVKKSN